MGFKGRIFGEILTLCVLLILDTQNIVSGCRLFGPDGKEVNLEPDGSGSPPLVGNGQIRDNATPGLLYNCTTENVIGVDIITSVDKRTYLEYHFDGTALDILLSDNYMDWEKYEESDNYLTIELNLNCPEAVRKVEFVAEINTFTNGYAPIFPETIPEILLPMPLPAGYTIIGEGGEVIEVTDYDFNSLYDSSVEFSLDDTTDLQVTSSKSEGKKWAVILKTTSTFRIEEPLTLTLVAKDVAPDWSSDSPLESKVNITIRPDIDNSTSASPLFAEPIYILDIKQLQQQQQSQYPTVVERPLPLSIAGYRRKRAAAPEVQGPAPSSNAPRETFE